MKNKGRLVMIDDALWERAKLVAAREREAGRKTSRAQLVRDGLEREVAFREDGQYRARVTQANEGGST